MPIKNFSKGKLAYPSKITTSDNKQELFDSGLTRFAALCRVDSDGHIDTTTRTFFLLNPTTFEEAKTANWVQHNVPGQSDPVLQWVSSGAKTITFDALVTLDTSKISAEKYIQEQLEEEENDIGTRFSRLAPDLFKAQKLSKVYKSEKTAQELDISNTLEYYRSLMYPSYVERNGIQTLESSPPLVVLLAGRTITQKDIDINVSKDTPTWVITDLRIKTTKMLPNMSPMEAVVTFTLVQYVKTSIDTYDFGLG